ncbi:AB hydrolase-1 domain-containing protein (Fragment) [Madurella fahalii]|uniref:AB hydrolase-1 domain-containing protein n=1 Tax=Madurella fahalii TaxID=1157608 RepID=A0ABQ0GIA5_9PEZI
MNPASRNIPGTATMAPKGLRQIAPVGDAPDDATIDIITIYGLGTESPRTWEFKKGGGEVVNWLSDRDILPAAPPKARIFTYDWNTNYFKDAPVQTLLGYTDTLLSLVAEGLGSQTRPIIFVASCFGGLILVEAINRAAQEGSAYRHILLSTVGVVFLATPFYGSDAAKQARWQRVQKFTEIVNAEAVRLPLYCFFETRKTEMLRRILSRGWAKRLATGVTHKILVTETSACLHGFPRQGLDATHSGMNKFVGPECPNFKLVKDVIGQFAGNAPVVLTRRKNCGSTISERAATARILLTW